MGFLDEDNRLTRNRYEYLIVAGGQAIHELGCPDVAAFGRPCYHENSLFSGATLEADAAITVALELLGLKVPPEEPRDGDDLLPWPW